MASRVLLLIVLLTVGLSAWRSEDSSTEQNDSIGISSSRKPSIELHYENTSYIQPESNKEKDLFSSPSEANIHTAGLEVGLQFSEEPQSVVVGKHKPLLLPCASPSPNITYHWTLDSRPLNLLNNSRVQLLNNGSLYFRKVVHKKNQTDQGVYRCVIRSTIGALVSRPARLQSAYMAYDFTEGGSSRAVSVVEGEAALFSCFIDSLPAAHISWQLNLQPVLQSPSYLILENGTLIIKSTKKEHQGEYRCTAFNSLANKTRVSEKLTLSVTDTDSTMELEISHPSANLGVNWTLGSRVEVPCVARGNSPPLVKWTKLLQDQSSTLVTNATEGVSVLIIDNVTDNDVGTYTCVASLTVVNKKTNTVSVTKEVKVEHLWRPPVIVKEPKSQEFPIAKTVRLQCEADGHPTPNIVWFKDGQKLLINGRIKWRNSELVLSNTLSTDSGVYQCLASNSLGEATASALALRLSVNPRSRERARPPSHVSCVTLSSSSVLLTWQQADVLTAFTVHYLPTNGGEEGMAVKEMVPDQVNQTMTIEKLAPFTNYTFYVRSYNRNAASDNSEDVVCRTGESVPRGAPELTIEKQGPATVVVEWSPLSPDKAQGEVSEYKVQWIRENTSSIHVDNVPGDVTRYVITDLSPETEYKVRVLAATRKGWPTLSDHDLPWSVVVTGSVSAFPSLISSPLMQLTVLNATTIQVRWTLSDSEKVKGFRLSYRKRNSPPSSPIELAADSTEYLLHDLDPQTWYEVQLRAVSTDAESEVSVKSVLTLPPSQSSHAHAPTPPSNLEATPTSAHSIHLAWDPSPDNVSYYLVSYNVVSSSIGHQDKNNTSYIKSSDREVTVEGLKPYTLYEMKVRSHDENNRYSEYSQALECRTLEGVAEKVTEIEYKFVNSNTVRLMWKAPEVMNGALRGYNIAYTRQPSSPAITWNNITVLSTRAAANVSGLTANVRYYMVVRALTAAGPGVSSDITEVLIPARVKPPPLAPPSTTAAPTHTIDQILGILLGCVIGLLLCGVSLVYRRKCYKPGRSCRSTSANGGPCFHSSSEHHEMQNIPPHLDTKGAHPNGDANGLKLPLLSNGRLPNGVVTRDKNVRITENPQFDCGVTVSCEELRQPSEEGDSLLSGHSLNDTQLTNVTSNSTPHNTSDNKHEPDDGFHESQQPVVGPNG